MWHRAFQSDKNISWIWTRKGSLHGSLLPCIRGWGIFWCGSQKPWNHSLQPWEGAWQRTGGGTGFTVWPNSTAVLTSFWRAEPWNTVMGGPHRWTTKFQLLQRASRRALEIKNSKKLAGKNAYKVRDTQDGRIAAVQNASKLTKLVQLWWFLQVAKGQE